jgi:hypothetical protein
VRPPDTTAFTQSDIDFRIEGDRAYLNRIHLDGDAVSLRGQGDINLQRQINLNFYALVGREEVTFPLLRPLFKEASRNVLAIQVNGTLDHPNITRHAFPELNETLQQLFPDLQARDGTRQPAGDRRVR